MPTLARIRGKRNNKKRKLQELEETRDAARTKCYYEWHEEVDRISYLENLPIEMLQEIFIESRNVNLAMVSKRLRAQVLSNHTKLHLVIGCFTDIDIRARRTIDHWKESDHAAVGRLRDLLSQSWFTFPLYEAAKSRWLIDTAASWLEDALCDDDEVLGKDERRETRSRVHRLLGELMEKGYSLDPADQLSRINFGRGLKSSRSVGSAGIECFERGSRMARLTFGEIAAQSRPHGRPGRSRNTFNAIHAFDWGRTRLKMPLRFQPEVYNLQHIPPSLLRRPLTQSTGDLLTVLLGGNRPWPRLDSPVHLTEAYDQLLIRALQHRCLAAISCLWTGPLNHLPASIFQHSPPQRFKFPPLERPHPCDADIWVRPLSVWQNPDHAYHHLPWKSLTFDFDGHLDLDMAPSEAHWAYCIRNFTKDPEFFTKLTWALRSVDWGRRLSDIPVLSNETLNTLFKLKTQATDRDQKTHLTDLYNVFTTRAVQTPSLGQR